MRPGVPVNLTMVVVRADGNCAPVQGAVVDIWHANAGGKYSDIASEGTSAKQYLRGLQATDASGQANFTTIFPGWYQGRAVHIHFKVRVFSGSTTTYEFNSQLFFDPALESTIYASSPYATRGQPTTANAQDGIYGSDGSKLLVALTANGSGGYDGTFVVGLSGLPSATGTGTGTANSVAAALSTTAFRRTAANRRILRATSTVAETVKVKARLSRNGTTLATKTVTGVTSGVRALELVVPKATGAGTARLTMTYTDGAGLAKTVRKTVKIPKKRLT